MKNASLIAFEVTRQCRFNCVYCRAGATASKPDELTTEQCKKILDSIAAFKRCVIIFTGGEPMERPDIYELLMHCRSLRLPRVMATCGYLINEKSIKKLKRTGIKALSFSIDGISPRTHDTIRQADGAFEATVRAAKITKEAGIPFQINTTISKLNIDEFVGIADLALKLGANCFNPFILVPTGRGKRIPDAIIDPIEYESLLNELLVMKMKSKINIRLTCGPQFTRICSQAKIKNFRKDVPGCIGGRNFGFISYKGDVQTCGFLQISAGNLVKNHYNFGKIWQESPLLNEIRDLTNRKGKCAVCDFASLCGGCRARAYALTGDYLASDPICKFVSQQPFAAASQ